jgi:LacI family transcriptional regulator
MYGGALDLMKKDKPVTIKDIAAATGYSVTTVSRVLNRINYPVKKDARNKILNSAKELNYVPNLLAKGLKTSKSREIAVIVNSFTNTFNISLLSGIENILLREGYNALFYNTKNLFIEKHQRIIESILSKRIEGVILPSVYTNPDTINIFLSNNIKVVLIDHQLDGMNCSSVYFNYKKGLVMLTEHFLEMGHRRIVYLHLKPDTRSKLDRLEGFRETLVKANIPYSDEYIFTYELTDFDGENPDFKAGVILAERVLNLSIKPTAIIADNDIMALGVLYYLNKNKISLPGDMSVAGYDGIIYSAMTYPPLTTIKVPAREMGESAANILIEYIKVNKNFEHKIIFEPELVKRESVSFPRPEKN